MTCSKLPKEFSRADAWRLIARIQLSNRSTGGTYNQLRQLARAGVLKPWAVPRERVKALIAMLATGNGDESMKWRPAVIAREPEVRGEAFPLRRPA